MFVQTVALILSLTSVGVPHSVSDSRLLKIAAHKPRKTKKRKKVLFCVMKNYNLWAHTYIVGNTMVFHYVIAIKQAFFTDLK